MSQKVTKKMCQTAQDFWLDFFYYNSLNFIWCVFQKIKQLILFCKRFSCVFPLFILPPKRRKKMKIVPTANPSWCFKVGQSVEQDVLISSFVNLFYLILFIYLFILFYFLVNLFKMSLNLWFDEGKNLRCKTSSRKNPQRLNMLLKKQFKYFALQVGIFVSFYKMFIFFIFIVKRFRQNTK